MKINDNDMMMMMMMIMDDHDDVDSDDGDDNNHDDSYGRHPFLPLVDIPFLLTLCYLIGVGREYSEDGPIRLQKCSNSKKAQKTRLWLFCSSVNSSNFWPGTSHLH